MVVEVPEPVLVTAPGLRVNVHVPVDGNPFRITLPVVMAQVGCVIVPTSGAEGKALTITVEVPARGVVHIGLLVVATLVILSVVLAVAPVIEIVWFEPLSASVVLVPPLIL